MKMYCFYFKDISCTGVFILRRKLLRKHDWLLQLILNVWWDSFLSLWIRGTFPKANHIESNIFPTFRVPSKKHIYLLISTNISILIYAYGNWCLITNRRFLSQGHSSYKQRDIRIEIIHHEFRILYMKI